MAPEPRRPLPLGRRGGVLVLLALAGVWAAVHLGLDLAALIPGEGGLKLAGEFFSRALTPALSHETEFKPDTPLLVQSLEAAWTTLLFASAAMGLSLLVGLVLGFFASTAWWADDPAASGARILQRTLRPVLYGLSRTLIAFMRSIHELLWALLLLMVLPTSPTTAILAIAIPYGGTLAKIFSEMVDETSRRPAHALRAAGAGGMQTFAFGLLPSALPDMAAYAFYRFECALRSAAILGFFGFATLGLRIQQAFENADFGETWTHLYMLILMVVVFDLWSGALRKRMVMR